MQNTENTKKKNGKYRSEHRKNSILTLQTSQKHRKYTAKNSDFSTKIWDFWNVCLRIPFSEALSLTSSTTLYNNVFSAVQTNNLEFQTTDLTRVCNSKHNKIGKILNFYSPALKKYQNSVFEGGSCFDRSGYEIMVASQLLQTSSRPTNFSEGKSHHCWKSDVQSNPLLQKSRYNHYFCYEFRMILVLISFFIRRNMTLFPKRVCCVPEDRLEMRAAGASEKNGISGYVVRSGGRGPGVGWGGVLVHLGP